MAEEDKSDTESNGDSSSLKAFLESRNVKRFLRGFASEILTNAECAKEKMKVVYNKTMDSFRSGTTISPKDTIPADSDEEDEVILEIKIKGGKKKKKAEGTSSSQADTTDAVIGSNPEPPLLPPPPPASPEATESESSEEEPDLPRRSSRLSDMNRVNYNPPNLRLPGRVPSTVTGNKIGRGAKSGAALSAAIRRARKGDAGLLLYDDSVIMPTFKMVAGWIDNFVKIAPTHLSALARQAVRIALSKALDTYSTSGATLDDITDFEDLVQTCKAIKSVSAANDYQRLCMAFDLAASYRLCVRRSKSKDAENRAKWITEKHFQLKSELSLGVRLLTLCFLISPRNMTGIFVLLLLGLAPRNIQRMPKESYVLLCVLLTCHYWKKEEMGVEENPVTPEQKVIRLFYDRCCFFSKVVLPVFELLLIRGVADYQAGAEERDAKEKEKEAAKAAKKLAKKLAKEAAKEDALARKEANLEAIADEASEEDTEESDEEDEGIDYFSELFNAGENDPASFGLFYPAQEGKAWGFVNMVPPTIVDSRYGSNDGDVFRDAWPKAKDTSEPPSKKARLSDSSVQYGIITVCNDKMHLDASKHLRFELDLDVDIFEQALIYQNAHYKYEQPASLAPHEFPSDWTRPVLTPEGLSEAKWNKLADITLFWIYHLYDAISKNPIEPYLEFIFTNAAGQLTLDAFEEMDTFDEEQSKRDFTDFGKLLPGEIEIDEVDDDVVEAPMQIQSDDEEEKEEETVQEAIIPCN